MGAPERRARLRKKWELLFVCKPWVVSIHVQENCVCDSLTRLTMCLTLLTTLYC